MWNIMINMADNAQTMAEACSDDAQAPIIGKAEVTLKLGMLRKDAGMAERTMADMRIMREDCNIIFRAVVCVVYRIGELESLGSMILGANKVNHSFGCSM
jgi:hypothetical protein